MGDIEGNESVNETEAQEQAEPVAAEQAEATAPEVDIDALKKELEDEQAKSSQYFANWQRSAADFVNYRRRVEQEKSELQKFGSAMLILRLLTIMDDMERAFTTIPAELAGFTWFQGMALIYRKLQAELEAQGLAEINAEGQNFDPNFHEAVLFGEGEEGKVVAVLQKGYTLHGRVIRPAMVKVGQGKTETPAEAPEEETFESEDTQGE